ncbi:mothers against decapentaplegic 6 [Biomphalaria glabrata]|nr:mothers against decapentaplegic-like protein 6-like [Biomphalaria glabrata]
MFRSKRNSLVKRLWKYKINDETRGSSQKDASRSSSPSTPASTTQEELELKTATHSFFKKLKEEQLQVLLQAMESRGGEITPCVPVAKSEIRVGKHMVSPYNLCCRVFRWPDLKSDAEMKRLPNCTFQNDEKDAVICCNPYHWSLVVKIDEPTIYTDKLLNLSSHCSRIEDPNDKYQGHYSPRIMESKDTTGFTSCVCQDNSSGNTEEHSSEQNHMYWCTLAYWELRERVGRLFQVSEPSCHVFQQLPHGNGVCLRLFQKPTNDEAVRRTREKIGFGIILSREAAHRNNVNLLRRSKEDDRVSNAVQVQQKSSSAQVSPTSSSSSGCGNNNNNTSSTSISTSLCLEDRGPEGGYPIFRNGCECGACIDHSVLCGHSSHCGHGQPRTSDYIECDTGQIWDESMDYSQNAMTIPPSSPGSHLPSPSSLSSSSSSPMSSPPAYFSSDAFVMTSGSPCSRQVPPLDAHLQTVNSSMKRTSSNKRTSPMEADSSSKMTKSLPSKQPNTSIKLQLKDEQSYSQPPTVHSSTELPYKQGEVWAYNASNFPIFVNSPTLDNPESPKSLVVKKVPPGYSIKIYDYARAELLEHTEARRKMRKDGPFDPCSVRISLAKGWGHNYSRQFITSCPCWLEVFFGVCRRNSSS